MHGAGYPSPWQECLMCSWTNPSLDGATFYALAQTTCQVNLKVANKRQTSDISDAECATLGRKGSVRVNQKGTNILAKILGPFF